MSWPRVSRRPRTERRDSRRGRSLDTCRHTELIVLDRDGSGETVEAMASHRTTGLPGGRPPLIQAVVWSLLLASGDHAPLAAASATIPASPLPQHARLALIGDSITEQMLYTRYVEAYLLACAGRTDLSVFQFGWGGETAATVLNRIDRGDLDAFHPTAVTIAYGANDGGSQTWADWMRVMWTGRITAVLTAVEKRYPGITPQSVICSPTWFELNRDGTNASGVAASNDTLGRFRAIDITVAQARGCGFADLRQRMQESSTAARGVLGPAYRIGGTDGVHAGPNGHLLMAYEILTALRMSGDIATITVDSLSAASVTASPGHTVVSHADGSITLSSSRYPFCTDSDHATAADRLSTILPFVPFTSELNRFMLVIAHCDAPSATITWGGESHNFTRAELAAGVNLAAAFRHTPFDGAFATLMERITTQEVKERDMIKAAGDATAPQKGWTDADVTARNALDRSTHDAIVPVTHTIRIVPNTGTGGAAAASLRRLRDGHGRHRAQRPGHRR